MHSYVVIGCFNRHTASQGEIILFCLTLPQVLLSVAVVVLCQGKMFIITVFAITEAFQSPFVAISSAVYPVQFCKLGRHCVHAACRTKL